MNPAHYRSCLSDSDQAQTTPLTFSHLANPSPESRKMALAQSLRPPFEGTGGGPGRPASPGSKAKAHTDKNRHVLESRSREEPFPLMTCRTKREEPGPRYHPCSFGHTSEDGGKLSLLTELRQGLQMA